MVLVPPLNDMPAIKKSPDAVDVGREMTNVVGLEGFELFDADETEPKLIAADANGAAIGANEPIIIETIAMIVALERKSFVIKRCYIRLFLIEIPRRTLKLVQSYQSTPT